MSHYHLLVAERDRILSTARVSTAARDRILGKPLYPAAPKAPKPVAPARPRPIPRIWQIESDVVPQGGLTIAAVQEAFVDALHAAGYRLPNNRRYERDDLVCPTRLRIYAWPRHVCMDLVRRLCLGSSKKPVSYPVIARAFAKNDDHTYALYGIKKTPAHMGEWPVLADVHARVLAHFKAKT